MKRPVRARERVILLPRAPEWRGREVERTIFGPPNKHYILSGSGKIPIQWDAHMGCWAETRRKE